jgi:cystathionine beta-lyase/cystathionine gamma-synthase
MDYNTRTMTDQLTRPAPALETLCAHAGPPRDGVGAPRPHVASLVQASVFDFATIEDSLPAMTGDGYVYRRNGMPNADELGAAVAALEGAEAGLATGSGMSAIAAIVLSACRTGDRVVVQRDAYGGSMALLDVDLRRLGVEVEAADAYDVEAFARAVAGGDRPPARLVLIETVSNPLLRCTDVAAIARVCNDADVRLVVDNTFATPLRDRPLAQGAAIVIHSVTKFLAGHHDVSAGAVVGPRAAVDAARGVAIRMGLGAPPFDAWLAVRGLRTLHLRMERAWATAAELAHRLGAHPTVRAVHTAERCALVTIDVGSREVASRVVAGLRMITLSPSLGGVTTTASHPATSSHRALTPDARAAAGIGDGLLRFSIGVEAIEDVWRDLAHALRDG